ncbi:pyridoxamine 5'-phosphate oxidase family protein [Novosphingobium album (ex Hu et al. 2023)]|uniref:Pyridoxamine 5'-phosphate oxidase family protein n=1 Tax=Novosphingobium album (ex Hu et al. 2023) TaxID=2930093 RepID=A0ABT0AX28_9SPHN|nr:pyridoxamine 5'-phosphate oxidase family protein [Novosphingobium album (ex Hu et al. 2023)]MCJ2177104.1 pyridoxamine 5'-phosphate oxidase family protein [Novosphingobium album (ex Hu et al. 2023)]
MQAIKAVSELEALYDSVVPAALTKVSPRLTPRYREWIGASRFVVLSTVGPDGTDASPRGDIGPVAQIADDQTILIPDWRGNNRLDSLRNIVADGRASLMFMVPGCNNVVRVNGDAIVTTDDELVRSFERDGKAPRTVIVITVREVYFQCAKALMRSGLWSGEDHSSSVPTAGQFIKELQSGFDAEAYDEGYREYARTRMW